MSTQLVRISAETEIPLLRYREQPVLTFSNIDTLHGRPEGTAKAAFHRNRKRFIEGEDFYVLESESLNVWRTEFPDFVGANAPSLTLITESGYLMLVKPFTDDLSWQIQRQLVKLYFRVKAAAEQPAPKPGIPDAQWREILGLIRDIASHCHFEGKANDAVHERIRWLGGVPSSRLLAPEQLEDIKAELTALNELADQHFKSYVARDQEFIRLFRERLRPLGRRGIADGAAVPRRGTVSAPLFWVTSPMSPIQDLPPGWRDVTSAERM